MEQKMGMEDEEIPEFSGGKSKSHEGIESPNGLQREEKLPSYVVNEGIHPEAIGANRKTQRLHKESKLRSWAEVLSGSISKQTVLKDGPNSGMGLSSKAINQELNEENNIVDQTNVGFSSLVDKGYNQKLDPDIATDKEVDSLDQFDELEPVLPLKKTDPLKNMGHYGISKIGHSPMLRKKRRDRGVRRTMKTKEGAQKMELSGCSL
ncbi:hypothetical protein V6N13_117122 [Hibiscus sabdariffa]